MEFTSPISWKHSYQEAGKPKMDEYLITGLKKQSGELFCTATLEGEPQKLIFDDLPAFVKDSIGMKIISL